jgi:hypothetical protein
MRRSIITPPWRVIAASSVCVLAVLAVGCTAKPEVVPVKPKPPVVSTETVEATPAPDPTTVPEVAPPVAPPATPAAWPSQVASFAKTFKGPVWYPTSLTKGYKVDAIDVLELETGSGLVCDIFYLSGDKEIEFIQGSPKTREYDIASVGTVPWGTDTADVTYEDPADTSTPRMIVYSKNGTLAEISGDASFDQLKALAASMVPVK